MLGGILLNYGKQICLHSKLPSRHFRFLKYIQTTKSVQTTESIQTTESLSKRNMSASRRARDLIVLVDMDGVLADFEGYFLQSFRKKWPEELFVPLEDRTSFYLYDDYQKIVNRDKVQDILNSQGFFRDLPPIEGAVDAVKEMSTMNGVQVFICTTPMVSSYRHSTVEKYGWVEEHLGKYWLDRMILTCDKTVVKGDILIDDKHFISGAEKRPSWKQILFTCCHNRLVPLKGRKRLDGWLPHETWINIIKDLKDELQRKR